MEAGEMISNGIGFIKLFSFTGGISVFDSSVKTFVITFKLFMSLNFSREVMLYFSVGDEKSELLTSSYKSNPNYSFDSSENLDILN